MITNRSFTSIRSNIFNSSDVVFLPFPKLFPHLEIHKYCISCLVEYGGRSFVSSEGFLVLLQCRWARNLPQTCARGAPSVWWDWYLMVVVIRQHGLGYVLPSLPGEMQLSETLGILPSNSSNLIWKKEKKAVSIFFVSEDTRRSTAVSGREDHKHQMIKSVYMSTVGCNYSGLENMKYLLFVHLKEEA